MHIIRLIYAIKNIDAFEITLHDCFHMSLSTLTRIDGVMISLSNTIIQISRWIKVL